MPNINCIECNLEYDTTKTGFWNCNKCIIKNLKITNCTKGQHGLCKDELCNVCYYRSLASDSKYIYLCNAIAREIRRHCKLKYLFNCECNHKSQRIPGDVIRFNNCGYCSPSPSLLCKKENNCNVCYNKSLASHEKQKYWDYEMNFPNTPYDISKFSSNKYWFICNVCNHNFDNTCGNIIMNNQWCPYCREDSNKLCKLEDCDFCYNKSCASTFLKEIWDPINIKEPRQVPKGHNTKLKFICKYDKSHIFEIKPSKIYYFDYWCKYCGNSTEIKVYNYLNSIFENVIHLARFEWCKNIKHLPFDIGINNILIEIDGKQYSIYILIEIDGNQHFIDVKYFGSTSLEQTIRDVYKMKKALEHNYIIIRISEEDIRTNKINWKQELESIIDTCSKSQVIYISKDPTLYNRHKQMMLEI